MSANKSFECSVLNVVTGVPGVQESRTNSALEKEGETPRRQRTRRMSRRLPGRHGRCQRGGSISGRERAEAKAETKQWHGASRLLQREPSAHRVETLGKRAGDGWQSPGHSRPEKLMMGHQKAFNQGCNRSAFKAKKLCQPC